MQKIAKTNAMRILDSMNIPYSIHTYSWDEEHLDAIHAAQSAGLNIEKVFKTIVMKNTENQLFVFCLPAEFEISLKKARILTHSKDIELLKLSELQKYTGYIRGGCSPLGMIRKYPTFIEETAQLEDRIFISAGQRGIQLEIAPNDLIKAIDGEYADFS